MSSDTIPGLATTPPMLTSDWVVSGTPTADPADDAVDAPSDVQPPPTAVVYPDVWVGISVPAADAVDAVEFSRIRTAVVPIGVPSAVPGMPAAPVGSSAFRISDTSVWSMAAITAPAWCHQAAAPVIHRCRARRPAQALPPEASAAPRSPRGRPRPAPASPGPAPTPAP